MNKEDYVSLEVAKKLKGKGFNELCHCYYCNDENKCYRAPLSKFDYELLSDRDFLMPSLYDAQKWLRNKHKLHVDVGMCNNYSTNADGEICHVWAVWTFSIYHTTSMIYDCEHLGEYDTYEEALNAGILEALKLI